MENYILGIKFAFSGAATTLAITSVAVVIGVFLGLLVALCRISNNKFLKIASGVYIDVLRGTPLLVQALLVYYGIPMFLLSHDVMFRWPTAFIASVLVCGINSSAYVAEIIRAGLQAVDKGQTEAARSIGMTQAQTMKFIVIPQAFRIIIPALGNEFITLIKETAVLSVITVRDITRASMLWASTSFLYWPAYIGTAICYLMLTIPLSKFMNWVERKMANDVKN